MKKFYTNYKYSSFIFFALGMSIINSANGFPQIVNGSFEDDTFIRTYSWANWTVGLGDTVPLTGWTTGWYTQYFHTPPYGFRNDPNGCYDPYKNANQGPTPFGNQAVVLGNVSYSNPTWIEQSVSGFTPGKLYTLTFSTSAIYVNGGRIKLSFPQGSTTPSKSFDYYNIPFFSFSNVCDFDIWHDVRTFFRADADTVTIRFSNEGGSSYADRVAIDNIQIENDEKIKLLGGIINDGSSTTALGESVDADGKPITASLPLGSIFLFQVIDSKINAPTEINSFTLSPSIIAPAITEPTLFKNNVVIPFKIAPNNIGLVQAMHLGETTLVITPKDTTIKPIEVKIKVTKPNSLGTAHNDIDDIVIDLSHRKGIPPQLLKGQIDRESKFNPLSYRYEPLSADFEYMSVGKNFRINTPYKLYRLETSDGLAQGTDILGDDIDPRSIYEIEVNGILRNIQPTDTFVSGYEIFTQNDRTQNWSKASLARAAQAASMMGLGPAPRGGLYDWITAQTTLASSYGYLQVMYATAIAPMGWTGNNNGQKNPSFLFDTEINRQTGGGSLELGSGYDRRMFAEFNDPTINPKNPHSPTPINIDAPQPLDDPNTLMQSYRSVLNRYNGTKKVDSSGNVIGDYGDDIVDKRSKKYPPLYSKPFLTH